MGIQERKEREKERRRQQIMVAAKQIFRDGVAQGLFVDRHPVALADTFWSF